MSASFYLADEKTVGADNRSKVVQNVLYFKFDRTGYDGRATKEHVKNFAHDFNNFKRANPDFKLPWGGTQEDLVHPTNASHILQPGDNVSTPVTQRKEERDPDDLDVRDSQEEVKKEEEELKKSQKERQKDSVKDKSLKTPMFEEEEDKDSSVDDVDEEEEESKVPVKGRSDKKDLK